MANVRHRPTNSMPHRISAAHRLTVKCAFAQRNPEEAQQSRALRKAGSGNA